MHLSCVGECQGDRYLPSAFYINTILFTFFILSEVNYFVLLDLS